MKRLLKTAFVLAASVPLVVVAAPAGAGTVTGGPAGVPMIGLRHSVSSNWSGYATYGSAGPFASVTATWVQPSLTCTSQNTYSSYWAGLDGYGTSTVEQLGTEADCSGGVQQNYAWYEMYPRPGYLISSVSVTAGHSYTASVVYQGSGRFLLSLTDDSSGRSFSTTQKLGSARLASAEAVLEAPWSGGTLPLANFGKANFSAVRANGSPLGGFSPLDPMTMENPYGMVATPSNFRQGNTAFSVTWSAS